MQLSIQVQTLPHLKLKHYNQQFNQFLIPCTVSLACRAVALDRRQESSIYLPINFYPVKFFEEKEQGEFNRGNQLIILINFFSPCAKAVAAPIPEVAPVTIQTFPSIGFAISVIPM
jgi:hypothetical protein